MERKFSLIQSNFAGERGSDVGVTAPAVMGVDEAYINGCFSELSFQSIFQPLSNSPYHTGVFSRSHSLTPMVESTALPPAAYVHFNQDFEEASDAPNTYQFLDQKLKMPKIETLDPHDFAFQSLKLNNTTTSAAVPPEPLINFFSSSSNGADACNSDVRSCFTHLPSLKSVERRKEAAEAQYQTGSLNEILNYQLTESSMSKNRVDLPPPWKNRYMPYRSSGIARQRRQRISDKTRCLQRLLPWDKKMDMGTMLEEAYKYIKFLQAQISILETMPTQSAAGNQNPSNTDVSSSASATNDVASYGELGELNRQQLLEVVVNSPVAQTLLYSRGCCIYSMEQLVLLQKIAEKKALWEQMMFASPLHFQ